MKRQKNRAHNERIDLAIVYHLSTYLSNLSISISKNALNELYLDICIFNGFNLYIYSMRIIHICFNYYKQNKLFFSQNTKITRFYLKNIKIFTKERQEDRKFKIHKRQNQQEIQHIYIKVKFVVKNTIKNNF